MDAATATEPIAAAPALHWPEYAMEAALLGIFMLAACAATTALEHPGSPLRVAIADPVARRALIGIAMGATAMLLVYSPWGQQSGAHCNPAVTLTYLRLGKIAPRDACGYVVAQCLGAVAGVGLVALAFGMFASHPAVRFAATVPGAHGAAVAFAAELAISFVLMSAILRVSNSRLARGTGVMCGVIVAAYIAFEAPYSGMSMNPARSLASAAFAGAWRVLWIYVSAPPLGMLAAAELHVCRFGAAAIRCAKLNHHGARRCIHCGASGAASVAAG